MDRPAPWMVIGTGRLTSPSCELFLQEFNEPTRAFLEHVETAEIWQVAYGRQLDSWRSPSGRIVLIGDAAHAMLPHKAMGLRGQGIEDAVALGYFMRWAPSKGIPFATEAYREAAPAKSEQDRGSFPCKRASERVVHWTGAGAAGHRS